MGDVPHIDRRTIDHFDGQIVELLDGGRAVVEADKEVWRTPILASPAGRIRFWLPMEVVTSSAETPLAVMAWGSRSTLTSLSAPPLVGELAAPLTVISCASTTLLPRSLSLAMGSVSLSSTNCTTGTSAASYCRISGGVIRRHCTHGAL